MHESREQGNAYYGRCGQYIRKEDTLELPYSNNGTPTIYQVSMYKTVLYQLSRHKCKL